MAPSFTAFFQVYDRNIISLKFNKLLINTNLELAMQEGNNTGPSAIITCQCPHLTTLIITIDGPWHQVHYGFVDIGGIISSHLSLRYLSFCHLERQLGERPTLLADQP